jgi:transcription antitermination factor NusG
MVAQEQSSPRRAVVDALEEKLGKFLKRVPTNCGTSRAVAFSGEGILSVQDQQSPWFAIMVRANREKNATIFLESAGYKCFLPINKFARQWSDRIKESERPLFPGYFFCRLNPLNRLPILMTPGVIQIVGIGKAPIPVEEEEVTAIQRAAESGLSVVPWPYMQVGEIARIEHGPLQGLSGIVIKVKSDLKLVLSVNLLQRSVAVEIDCSWISARSSVRPISIHHPTGQLTSRPIVPSKQEDRSAPYGKAS